MTAYHSAVRAARHEARRINDRVAVVVDDDGLFDWLRLSSALVCDEDSVCLVVGP